MAERNTPSVKVDGVEVGTAKYIDFRTGSNVTLSAVYDSVAREVDVTINSNALGGSNAHVIKEAGTPLAQRSGLNFLAGFDLTDDGAGDETEVALDLSEAAGGGDLTWSTNTPTVSANAVTFAKMQDIGTDRLIGRDTAATGDPEQLTVGGGLEFTGSGGIQRSALTGDVTASAGSGTTAIANDSITYAKIQNVSATDRLLGRDTAGAGDIEELTATGGIEFTGTGIRHAAFTGDVTSSAGGTVNTIANDAVTYAKMQNTSTGSVLLGRGTSGAGDPQEITLGANLSMAGTTLSSSGAGGSISSVLVDLESEYGVVGGNVGNQATAINQAITDFSADTGAFGIGATLILPPGDIRITAPIEMRSQITLQGSGKGASVLRPNGAIHGIILHGTPPTNEHVLTVIRDLYIHCGAQTGSTDGIFYDQSTGDNSWPVTLGSDPIHTIAFIYVLNASRYGIHILGEAGQGALLFNCFVRNAGSTGIYAEDAADCQMVNCKSASNAGPGFEAGGGNNHILRCSSFFNDTDGFVLSSSRAQVTDCLAQDNGRHGFNSTGADHLFTGCMADSNNRLNISGDGFVLAGQRWTLGSCTVHTRSGAGDGPIPHAGSGSGNGTHRYGLNITAAGGSVQGYIRNWLNTGAAVNNTQNAQTMSFEGLVYSGLLNRYAISANATANGGTAGQQSLASTTVPIRSLFLGTTYRWWAAGTQTLFTADVTQQFRVRLHNSGANITNLYSTTHSRSGLSQGYAHGSNMTRLVAGALANTNITVTGIETSDSLVSVMRHTTAASVTTITDITSTCTITAQNTIQSTLITTNDNLEVRWGRQFDPNGTITTARDWFGIGVFTCRSVPGAVQNVIGAGHVHFPGSDQGGGTNASGGFDTDSANTGTIDGTQAMTIDATIEFGAGRTASDVFTLEQFVLERIA